MKDTFTIGIDLGGTNLKGGVVDSSGRVVVRQNIRLGSDKSVDKIITYITELIKRFLKSTYQPIAAVGCGVPGIVDMSSGIVHHSPNLPDWDNVPVRDQIAARIGLPAILDNDANMWAAGEICFGAGKGCRNMVLLTLGSGIGGGLVLNGDVFRGDEGFAGEVGHIVIDPDGPFCNCGGRGCWEHYAASRAFATHALKLPKGEFSALLARAGGNISHLTPELMATLAKNGDEVAIKLWHCFGRYLGIGIATLLNVLGVETFVIGGGIARSFDNFSAATRDAVLAHTYSHHSSKFMLKKATLGDDGGIIGAAVEASKRLSTLKL